MKTATIEITILDAEEAQSVVNVAKAAVNYMKWAAPTSMTDDQWDAWTKLNEAVRRLDGLYS